MRASNSHHDLPAKFVTDVFTTDPTLKQSMRLDKQIWDELLSGDVYMKMKRELESPLEQIIEIPSICCYAWSASFSTSQFLVPHYAFINSLFVYFRLIASQYWSMVRGSVLDYTGWSLIWGKLQFNYILTFWGDKKKFYNWRQRFRKRGRNLCMVSWCVLHGVAFIVVKSVSMLISMLHRNATINKSSPSLKLTQTVETDTGWFLLPRYRPTFLVTIVRAVCSLTNWSESFVLFDSLS